MITPASPEVQPQQPDHGADDGWLHSWEQELLAENELIAQVQAASLDEPGPENARPAGPSGQGKKKKAKKITLMSTTARRAA